MTGFPGARTASRLQRGNPYIPRAGCRRVLHEKEETQSTNDDVRTLAKQGAPHGTAVLAHRQTAGRGRAGRSFASPTGGAYLSILLRPRAPAGRWGVLPLAVGVGALDALADHGFQATLKWPNDILIDRRKVGGILVEGTFGAEPFAVVGIGINVRATPADLPDATCLAAHAPPPEPRALADALVARVLDETRRWEEDAKATLARARAACVTLGRPVEWDKEEGRAIDIDDDGALIVEYQGGRVRIVAGDVRVREKR